MYWMNCQIRIIGLLSFVFILSFANTAEACELNLESNPQSSHFEYNAQARTASPQKLTLRVRNTSSDKCIGVLSVQAQGRDNYLSAGSQFLTFRMYGSSNTSQLLLQSNANLQNTVPMNVEAQASETFDLFLVIDSGQNALAGTYASDLDVRFDSKISDIMYNFPFRVETIIKPNIQANITGLGTASISDTQISRNRNSLELGELIPKKSYKLGLQIRSNAPVSINVNSKNGGFLRHQSEPSEISYALELNGESLNIKQTSRINGLSSINKNGRTNPMNIRLSDFGSNLPSGNYSDVITFHISAR